MATKVILTIAVFAFVALGVVQAGGTCNQGKCQCKIFRQCGADRELHFDLTPDEFAINITGTRWRRGSNSQRFCTSRCVDLLQTLLELPAFDATMTQKPSEVILDTTNPGTNYIGHHRLCQLTDKHLDNCDFTLEMSSTCQGGKIEHAIGTTGCEFFRHTDNTGISVDVKFALTPGAPATMLPYPSAVDVSAGSLATLTSAVLV